MLQITVPATEQWDERTQEFVNTKTQTLQLEHSLVSLSKWESIHHKPFLSKNSKTFAETIDYVKCMTITQNVDPNVYNNLTNENIKQIDQYIDDPMTATTFSKSETGKKNSGQIVTAELIYYWMIALNIPFECQKWHLNKLLTLIQVCNIKNKPPKKRNKKEIMSRNATLNAERRKLLNSSG